MEDDLTTGIRMKAGPRSLTPALHLHTNAFGISWERKVMGNPPCLGEHTDVSLSSTVSQLLQILLSERLRYA